MRILYLFFFLLCFRQMAIAQFEERPSTFNNVLLQQAELQQQAHQNTIDRLTRQDSKNEYRNADCYSKVMDVNTVLQNTATQICVDTFCLGRPFESLQITCSPAMGTATLVDNTVCFNFQTTSDQIGADTVCIKVCDNGGSCHTLVHPFNVTAAKSLPFFEDFAYDGPYPRLENWVDRNVFVNNTLAALPPSVGVATFDGIGAGGKPYGGGFGQADFLTSTFFNLDGFSESDNIYLSYYLQRKGLGDKPEESDDITLEFKNNLGEWKSIDTYPGFPEGTGSNVNEGFLFYSHKIEADEFFHDAFQFRFINQNTRTGAIDLWHLDYVRLEANSDGESAFEDIAFTNAPLGALRNYANMPRNHFKGFEEQELADSVSMTLINHFPSDRTIEGNSAVMTELINSVAFIEFQFLDGSESTMSARDTLSKTVTNPFFTTWVAGTETNFANEDSALLKMTYSIKENGQFPQAILNDTVNSFTYLTDYFAYDDGTSESNIIAQNVGTEIAVKYTANVDDTLRAVRFHFPRVTTDVSNQLFNIKVYVGQLDEEPEYSAVLQKPLFTDSVFDTLQGFTTYTLFEDNSTIPKPLFVPAGDFYISWQQVGGTEIPIGLDKNNPKGVRNAFFSTNSGSSWQPFPNTFDGAIMLRAVFGKETPEDTSTPTEDVITVREWMEIFPNPASDNLYFKVKNGNYADFEIAIYNTQGQLLRRNLLNASVPIDQLNPGLYILQVRHLESNETRNHKFLKH